MTAKPRFARPMAWVPIPHETSRIDRDPNSPALVNDARELSGLPLDTRVPIREDQMIKTRHSVVEIAHRLTFIRAEGRAMPTDSAAKKPSSAAKKPATRKATKPKFKRRFP